MSASRGRLRVARGRPHRRPRPCHRPAGRRPSQLEEPLQRHRFVRARGVGRTWRGSESRASPLAASRLTDHGSARPGRPSAGRALVGRPGSPALGTTPTQASGRTSRKSSRKSSGTASRTLSGTGSRTTATVTRTVTRTASGALRGQPAARPSAARRVRPARSPAPVSTPRRWSGQGSKPSSRVRPRVRPWLRPWPDAAGGALPIAFEAREGAMVRETVGGRPGSSGLATVAAGEVAAGPCGMAAAAEVWLTGPTGCRWTMAGPMVGPMGSAEPVRATWVGVRLVTADETADIRCTPRVGLPARSVERRRRAAASRPEPARRWAAQAVPAAGRVRAAQSGRAARRNARARCRHRAGVGDRTSPRVGRLESGAGCPGCSSLGARPVPSGGPVPVWHWTSPVPPGQPGGRW